MRVGVCVDGFNLFYGGRALLPDNPGWKWLDLRRLAQSLVDRRHDWPDSSVTKVVYCTAEVTDTPPALARQQRYVLALRSAGSVDLVEYGAFQATIRESVAAAGTTHRFKLVTASEDPLPNAPWTRLGDDGLLRVRHRRRDEKGSDVNVAANLLIDVLEGRVDAAMVLSNDSDLSRAVAHARHFVPVGMVNPRGTPTAGALRGERDEGVGRHWWYRLTAADLLAHPLPDRVADYHRPLEWRRHPESTREVAH